MRRRVRPVFGGPEHIGRDAPLDGKHPVLEILEAQRHQLATPRPGVGREADKQPDLLGLVPALGITELSGGNERVGRIEQAEDLVAAEMQTRPGAGRTTHAPERVDVDDALDVGPTDGRAQHAETPEITATDAPAALHDAIAARTCSGLSVDTRRAEMPSARSALTFERAPIHVAGHQS